MDDPHLVTERVLVMMREGTVQAVTGEQVRVRADTVCVHGDTPGAARLAAEIRKGLEAGGIEVAPMCSGS